MLNFIGDKVDLKHKSILISAIGCCDLPTLALDNLIGANQLKRIAYFCTDCLVPSVGYLPSSIEGGQLGLPGELYALGDMLILQFRSSCRIGRKKQLVQQIKALITAQQFKQVILVSAFPSSIKTDYQISQGKDRLYYHIVQGDQLNSPQINKEGLSSISLLKDEDEENSVILANGGLANNFDKQKVNMVQLFMLTNKINVKDHTRLYAQQIIKILGVKELSKFQ